MQLALLQAVAAGRSRDVKGLRDLRLRDHVFELGNTDPELADALMYACNVLHCLRRGMRAKPRDRRLDWFTQFRARKAEAARP